MRRIKHYKTVLELADEIRSEILSRPPGSPVQPYLDIIERFLIEGQLPSELLDLRQDRGA